MLTSAEFAASYDHRPGFALLQVDEGARWLLFQDPVAVVETRTAPEVQALLAEVVEATQQRGLHAAGFLAYEAAPAFDAAMPGRPSSDHPLLWFGLYREPQELAAAAPDEPFGGQNTGEKDPVWRPLVKRREYGRSVRAIKDAIARGDTYQVNYTFPLQADFTGDPWALFRRMLQAQRCQYAAFIDTGQHVVCSASPELFWRLDGDRLVSRPMKGTAARGRTLDEDMAQREWLLNSTKNRAENVMIVDMVRNDMGRVARYGTVHVPALFDVERYPTVWQMTSTVACETDASLKGIMDALFPCASITGAPKVRTMQIINHLETEPRGVYTGCIGVISPQRRAQFNVAIRTVVIDKARGEATYGVGGGVVWDSETGAEYDEALLKAQVLTRHRPPFSLLETMRWTPEEGYFLLDRHLRRLAASGEYFQVAVTPSAVIERLKSLASTFVKPQRVRLTVSQAGDIRVLAEPLAVSTREAPVRVGKARTPVDSRDPFLFHKTTHRTVYEHARRSRPDCDDVLLWNEQGEVTETTIANVLIEDGDTLLTPPIRCGLLAGTLRADLLENGLLREAPILIDDLVPGQRLELANSVRGRFDALYVG